LVPDDRERQRDESAAFSKRRGVEQEQIPRLWGGGEKRAADILAARRRCSYILNVVDGLYTEEGK
jgi:hypothetical protein